MDTQSWCGVRWWEKSSTTFATRRTRFEMLKCLLLLLNFVQINSLQGKNILLLLKFRLLVLICHVIASSGAAADEGGVRAGSRSLLRLRRGLRGRRPGLPLLSLHLSGPTQRPEPDLPAHWHQAGEGRTVKTFGFFCLFVFLFLLILTSTFHFAQDTWLYHLNVAAGSSAMLKVGTECEQLIGKLMDVEGDPGEKLKPTLSIFASLWVLCLGGESKHESKEVINYIFTCWANQIFFYFQLKGSNKMNFSYYILI